MRVAYIAETSLDNRSAYTHHVIKMCDAFSKNCKTTLIIPFTDKKISFKKIRINSIKTAKKHTWENRVDKILLEHKSLI